MLYLVATPIGNLEDLTFRAVSTLKGCDYILCEDTRHSRILTNHYQIETPLKSFHKFKEQASEERILEDLEMGKTIALISDAGTPLIADPGESLVARCHERGIPVSAIPGACALVTALTLSGFPPIPFQFLGFLPKTHQDMRHALLHALLYKGTTVSYEAPHRISDTLERLEELAPQRKLCVARELTKRHEECLFGNATELLTHFKTHPARGEMVLLISGCGEEKETSDLPLKEFVAYLQNEFSLHKTEAIKLAAEIVGLPKREVYNKLLNDA